MDESVPGPSFPYSASWGLHWPGSQYVWVAFQSQNMVFLERTRVMWDNGQPIGMRWESLRGETAGPKYKHQHHRFVQGSTRASLSTTTCPTGSVAPSTHQLASAPSSPQRPLHCWTTYGQEAGLDEPARIRLFICPSSLPSLLHSTSMYAVPTPYQALCKPLQMQQ